jgi:hypothetical protein
MCGSLYAQSLKGRFDFDVVINKDQMQLLVHLPQVNLP